MIALGLLLLAAAVIVALVGVLANTGSAHALNSDFSLFGYHLHGSTGQLLLIGVIVGAVGMLGLNMLLAGIGRGFSRRVSSRRELKHTRRQADSLHEERDTLAHQLEQERISRARTEAEQAAARDRAAGAGSIAYPCGARTGGARGGRAGNRASGNRAAGAGGACPIRPHAQPGSAQPGSAQPGSAQPGSAGADSPGAFRRFMRR